MGGDERQLAGKPCAERLDIVRRLRPRLLLRLAVIVAGQFLDAGAENLRQERHVLRQHRTHREFFLRAASHGTYLPRGDGFSSIWIFAVFHRHMHFCKFVTYAICFFEVFCFARGIPCFNKGTNVRLRRSGSNFYSIGIDLVRILSVPNA